jgi:hypothetical protein
VYQAKCIKLYCEYFKVCCTEACNCHSCANRENHEVHHNRAIIQALASNPEAFSEQEPQPNGNVFSLGFQKEIRRGYKLSEDQLFEEVL